APRNLGDVPIAKIDPQKVRIGFARESAGGTLGTVRAGPPRGTRLGTGLSSHSCMRVSLPAPVAHGTAINPGQTLDAPGAHAKANPAIDFLVLVEWAHRNEHIAR